ncbi:GntR family transcriptional regulator [Fodinicurvata sediminis]|uniref:GntR family transcriptional regulator n=1 Tax=Fodinicurvata sediminis TaxID=1121832 RepID=UPI0003B38E45|nr:GntR family transcriptional regulator [Fodinicurvata sediminis]
MDENNIDKTEIVPLGKLAKSLPTQLADLLLEEVMMGRLKPGDRLKEGTLAQQHAVSRATVREALIALEEQGYVIRTPRSGARIAEYSQEDIDHIFEIRAALLAVAARRFARLKEEALKAKLLEMVEGLERIAADDSATPQDFANESVRAQLFLVQNSGNQRLPEFYERLAGMSTWQLIRGRSISFLTSEDRKQSAADWRQLATAITRGRQVGADRAARQLLEHSALRVSSNLARVGQGTDAAIRFN